MRGGLLVRKRRGQAPEAGGVSALLQVFQATMLYLVARLIHDPPGPVPALQRAPDVLRVVRALQRVMAVIERAPAHPAAAVSIHIVLGRAAAVTAAITGDLGIGHLKPSGPAHARPAQPAAGIRACPLPPGWPAPPAPGSPPTQGHSRYTERAGRGMAWNQEGKTRSLPLLYLTLGQERAGGSRLLYPEDVQPLRALRFGPPLSFRYSFPLSSDLAVTLPRGISLHPPALLV